MHAECCARALRRELRSRPALARTPVLAFGACGLKTLRARSGFVVIAKVQGQDEEWSAECSPIMFWWAKSFSSSF